MLHINTQSVWFWHDGKLWNVLSTPSSLFRTSGRSDCVFSDEALPLWSSFFWQTSTCGPVSACSLYDGTEASQPEYNISYSSYLTWRKSDFFWTESRCWCSLWFYLDLQTSVVCLIVWINDLSPRLKILQGHEVWKSSSREKSSRRCGHDAAHLFFCFISLITVSHSFTCCFFGSDSRARIGWKCRLTMILNMSDFVVRCEKERLKTARI